MLLSRLRPRINHITFGLPVVKAVAEAKLSQPPDLFLQLRDAPIERGNVGTAARAAGENKRDGQRDRRDGLCNESFHAAYYTINPPRRDIGTISEKYQRGIDGE